MDMDVYEVADVGIDVNVDTDVDTDAYVDVHVDVCMCMYVYVTVVVHADVYDNRDVGVDKKNGGGRANVFVMLLCGCIF